MYICVRETFLTNSIRLCVFSFSLKSRYNKRGISLSLSLSLSADRLFREYTFLSASVSLRVVRCSKEQSKLCTRLLRKERTHKKQNKNGEQHTGEENHPSAISGEEDEQNASYESSPQYSDDYEYEEYDKEKEERGKGGPVTSGRNREESETSVD